jgi:hypothetical protein
MFFLAGIIHDRLQLPPNKVDLAGTMLEVSVSIEEIMVLGAGWQMSHYFDNLAAQILIEPTVLLGDKNHSITCLPSDYGFHAYSLFEI